MARITAPLYHVTPDLIRGPACPRRRKEGRSGIADQVRDDEGGGEREATWADYAQWRAFVKRGDCYAMVITDACAEVAGVHQRMPVILRANDWATRLDGEANTAEALYLLWDGALQVERTEVPLVGRGSTWAVT